MMALPSCSQPSPPRLPAAAPPLAVDLPVARVDDHASAAHRNAARLLAFRTHVLPLERVLHARAMGLERSAADARDLVQDTFERALRCFDQFQPGTNAKQWVFRIMFNLFVDRYRRRSHETSLESLDALELAAPEPEPAPRWHAYEVEDVISALGHLEPRFREVLQLHFAEHRSYKEISGALGIPQATVGTRLLRARSKLRTILDNGAPSASA